MTRIRSAFSGLICTSLIVTAEGACANGQMTPLVPGVRSMTDANPVTPPPKSGDGGSEKPTDELTEELTRTVKAAYQ